MSSSPTVADGSLLLVVDLPAVRHRLQRILTGCGFCVVTVNVETALAAANSEEFAYAVVEPRFRDRNALSLIRRLREQRPWIRIVVITDHDSFATVVLVLRAGADDYLPVSACDHELADALLGRRSPLPPIPETPLAVQRIRWEHTQRVLAQCGRNMSDAARRLRMHRRTLQRLLSKRAPYPRRAL